MKRFGGSAKKTLDDGAVTPAWSTCSAIIKLLNDSLAARLVCVLRYKRHHFMATGRNIKSPISPMNFLVRQ
jgi:bacterioferritin